MLPVCQAPVGFHRRFRMSEIDETELGRAINAFEESAIDFSNSSFRRS